jgi:hypothetical protein
MNKQAAQQPSAVGRLEGIESSPLYYNPGGGSKGIFPMLPAILNPSPVGRFFQLQYIL